MDPAMRVSQSELFKILIIDPTETGKALKRALHFVTQNLNIYLTSQVNRDLFTLIDEICPLAILIWADENRKGVCLGENIRLKCKNFLGHIIFYGFLNNEYLESPLFSEWVKTFHHYLNMPFQLKDLLLTLQDASISTLDIELEKLREEIFHKRFESLSVELRHQFKNHMAAVRILLGAIGTGDIEKDEAFEVLATLSEKEKAILDDPIIDFMLEVESLGIPKGKDKPLKELIVGKKIVLIDDEVESAGWQSCLGAILGKTLYCYVDYQNALKDLESADLLILDLKLPDDPKQGIDVLETVKNNWPYLPVIIFSAINEVPYARKALKIGASDYFVKELSLRDSIKYYKKLRKMVLNALLQKDIPHLRVIWRRIQKIGNKVRGTALSSVYLHLKKAYYFLQQNDIPLVHLILSQEAITPYAESILQSVMAVECIIEHRIRSLRKRPKFDSPIKKLEQLLKLDPKFELDELASQLFRHRPAHGGGGARLKAQRKEAINVLEQSLTLVEKYLGEYQCYEEIREKMAVKTINHTQIGFYARDLVQAFLHQQPADLIQSIVSSVNVGQKEEDKISYLVRGIFNFFAKTNHAALKFRWRTHLKENLASALYCLKPAPGGFIYYAALVSKRIVQEIICHRYCHYGNKKVCQKQSEEVLPCVEPNYFNKFIYVLKNTRLDDEKDKLVDYAFQLDRLVRLEDPRETHIKTALSLLLRILDLAPISD